MYYGFQAPIAQLAEQLPFKQLVAGSSPAGGTKLFTLYRNYGKVFLVPK